VLDALQDDRVGGIIDTADRTPIALPYSHPALVTAERPGTRMGREGFSREGLCSPKQQEAITRWQPGETPSGAGRNDQFHI
jgi:hypothetical protein